MLGLLKIFAAFAAIVFLVRKKVQLGTAMLLGSVVLALLSWASWTFLDSGNVITPAGFVSIIGESLWDPSSEDPASVLKLVGVIVLVLVLSHCLDRSGQMTRILRSFQGLVGDVRVVLISLPALIGLLPMPGGAVFSAPMVEEAQKKIALSPTKKTLINYWFRHLWEYSWPLYPGLLLAAELARKSGLNVSVFKLASLQFPLTAAALAGGILFIMPDVPRSSGGTSERNRGFRLGHFAVDLSPIAIIIAIVVFLYTAMGMGSKDSLLVGLVVAVLLTLGITALRRETPPTAVLKSLSVPRILSLVYVVISLMIFRGTIQESGSVEEVSAMMRAYHVPLFPFAVFLSFICGLVTGLAMAYVAIVFPILIPLVLQMGSEPLPYLVLAFGSGFIGVLFSPVHVCLILTHQYFTSGFSPVYRKMIAPTLIIFATLVAIFLVLSLTPP